MNGFDVVAAAYLFLPAGIANATPPLLTRMFGPGRPISTRAFGSHKTWMGLAGGTAAGFATFLIQRSLDHWPFPLILGFAMSFGALAGDLVKSFVKRRMHIAPGKRWFPADQLDYVFGALAASAPFARLTPLTVVTVTLTYFALHLVVSAAGFALGVKESPI